MSVVIFCLALPAQRVRAQSLVVDKNSGTVGSQITITAQGFDPEKYAIVEFDDIHIADIDTDSKGDIHYNIEIPESTSGAHTLTVSDGSNVANAQITTLPSLYVVPSHGPASSTAQVTGQGFAANKLITAVLGDIHVATTASGEKGSFNTEFVVPPLPSGTYKMTASDEVNRATSAFNVTITITLSASEGFVGMQLAVAGSGFVNGITILYDDEVLDLIKALSDGTFSTNVTVPESKKGHHTITFLDANHSISVTFTVESDPPPVPKILLPTSSETTVSDPTFEWWPVTDPSGVTYSLEIATDPSFIDVILYRYGLRVAKYSLSTEERLSPSGEKPYYWRVKAVDRARNESEWSEPHSFYVKAFPSWAIYMIIAIVSVVVTIVVIQRRTKAKADK